MSTRARKSVFAALGAGLVLAGTAPALADDVVADGDGFVAPITNQDWNVGTVCTGASDTRSIPVAIVREGTSLQNTFKNGTEVSVNRAVTGTPLTVESGPKPIAVPGDWQDRASGTTANTTFNVTYTAPSVAGAFSGTVEFTGIGVNAHSNGNTIRKTDRLTVSGTAEVCAPATPQNNPPQVAVTGVSHGATYEAGAVPAAGCSVTDEDANAGATPQYNRTQLNGQGVGSETVTCSYTDSGNLSGSASATYSIVDTTAPTLSNVPANITEEATSAAGAEVTWTAPTASGRTGETRSVSCSPMSGSWFGLGTTTVSCTASDGTGNTSAAQTFDVTVRDTTAPTLDNMPANQSLTATSANGAVATWTAPTASDAVDANATTTCSPASGDTFALGNTTVSCTASDASGNESAAQSFTVNVTYAASGALQPINANGSSIFKLGSTVPVKFQLTGDSAGITNAIANIKVARVTTGIAGTESEATTSTAASTGSAFRYDSTSNQYIYNWGTKGMAEGTYQIRIDLGDGKGDRTVNVSLKK